MWAQLRLVCGPMRFLLWAATTNGVVEAKSEERLVSPQTLKPQFVEGNKGAFKTIHPQGDASRPGSPGVRVSEGHLRLTENVLCEQRRNLRHLPTLGRRTDRKSTRLNSSHSSISYAVFCLK